LPRPLAAPGSTGSGISGTYVLNVGGIAPKAPDGTCDTGHASPAKGRLTVRLRGPLTLNAAS
jgi:hypothetical protein